MTDHQNRPNRCKVLECMTWAGTGVLWTISGGVPHSLGLVGEAMAADAPGLTFLQISDSHMGFDKPANPNAKGTLEEAISQVKALKVKPSFMIHTGDITHLSKVSEFDDADQIISQARLDVHYVPGEHDIIDPENKLYKERYGRGTKGSGYYSFDANGVHFIALVNTLSLEKLGHLGGDQIDFVRKDVAGLGSDTPIVVFSHIPLFAMYPKWGWGTDDALQVLALLKRFASVTCLNGHVHQLFSKTEGNVTFRSATTTAYPLPAPGHGPAPTPQVLPAGHLKAALGIRTITYTEGNHSLAVTDEQLT